ncbi:HAUS augmin-like complex subunit 6 [Brienomyrus brachyistius]|uniref:HAUS augmin-like complex subunit 6 n=1 Tax=Brienomyrus brachyistius TaxID=42636 RepID=UPI0020B306B3|nr:HAUS augmin-like complex subunit 6 [Brienomyrus brachyistius]
MAGLQENSKYLWWALLSLGFQPEAAAASAGFSKKNVRHVNLGMSMFEKPNKDAFYVVTYFLFEKLNPGRAHELFRYCCPILDRKADAEFRKVTFAWLRDIAAEYGNAFPKVVASLFLSPGGLKFISLMFHLAKHVMLQEMKSFSTDGWVPESVVTEAKSVEMAVKRFQLVKSRFLRAAVEQDCVIQSYQRKAQTLVKSIRDRRAEEAKYDDLLKTYEQEDEQQRNILSEKVIKVRSLWTNVNKILSSLKEERAVVDSVVKGDVDQYVLDGTDLALKIPRCLLDQIENSCQMSSAGNVYEGGQLNVLSLLELLREALVLLEQERLQLGSSAPEFNLQHLEEQASLLGRALDALRLTGRKVTKEEIPEVKGSIQKMQELWDRKWAESLGRTPLQSFLTEDPALKFLSPMAPLSFESEAGLTSCIFSQYPAMLPDELPAQQPVSRGPTSAGNVGKKDRAPESSSATAPANKSVARSESSRPSTPCKPPSSRSTPCCNPLPAFTQTGVLKHASVRNTRPRVSGAKKKAVILDQECDSLADQFAAAVTGGSVDNGIRGLDLEDLLSTLSDPFSTRKQLPRTPESLISEVKRSWKKALEEGEAEKTRLSGRFADCTGRSSPARHEALQAACPSLTESLLGAAVAQTPETPIHQATESLNSTLPWDSVRASCTQADANDIVQFGIANETMPDLLGDESLGSSNGSLEDDGEEPAFPQLLPNLVDFEGELRPACDRLGKIREAYGNMSYQEDGQPLELQSPQQGRAVSPEEADWKAGDKVFSLDLDALESPSPTKGRCSLPKLVTFSPLDDF